MTDNFWRDKQCLVIGGAGFIGKHLVQRLLKSGAQVKVLDDLSRGNRGELTELVYGDCSDEGICRDAMKDQQYVFNLAAWVAGVDYNQRHQSEMYMKNWMAQMTPMRIAAEYQIERYLSVSSVCVYAPGFNAPCVEKFGFKGEPTRANLGYALAKRAGERMAIWYAEEGLHTVRVRPSNVYGPGDWFDERAHVIPALIRKTIENDKIVVNGTGRERREFLYVTDAARGMMNALQFGRAGDGYNLGTDAHTSVSIAELARLIRIDVGVPGKPIVFERRFDSGDSMRWSNASKAHLELRWRHEVEIEEGLQKTVEWYKNVQKTERD